MLEAPPAMAGSWKGYQKGTLIFPSTRKGRSSSQVLVLYSGQTGNCNALSPALVVEDDERLLVRIERHTYQTIGESHPEHPYGLVILPRRPGKPVTLECNQQHYIGGPEIWKETLRLTLDKP